MIDKLNRIRETDEITNEAEAQFNEYVERFIGICKQLIVLGAKPDDSVQKLKEFRGEKGKAMKKTPADLQTKMLKELIEKKLKKLSALMIHLESLLGLEDWEEDYLVDLLQSQ